MCLPVQPDPVLAVPVLSCIGAGHQLGTWNTCLLSKSHSNLRLLRLALLILFKKKKYVFIPWSPCLWNCLFSGAVYVVKYSEAHRLRTQSVWLRRVVFSFTKSWSELKATYRKDNKFFIMLFIFLTVISHLTKKKQKQKTQNQKTTTNKKANKINNNNNNKTTQKRKVKWCVTWDYWKSFGLSKMPQKH